MVEETFGRDGPSRDGWRVRGPGRSPVEAGTETLQPLPSPGTRPRSVAELPVPLGFTDSGLGRQPCYLRFYV